MKEELKKLDITIFCTIEGEDYIPTGKMSELSIKKIVDLYDWKPIEELTDDCFPIAVKVSNSEDIYVYNKWMSNLSKVFREKSTITHFKRIQLNNVNIFGTLKTIALLCFIIKTKYYENKSILQNFKRKSHRNSNES